ncbi:hypothetical protein LY76DRAFT_363942 [Colletotrichum caudatum]|nr:hypothetical protein LY76DRAFT_363942 [Colletotrichum caudatum]
MDGQGARQKYTVLGLDARRAHRATLFSASEVCFTHGTGPPFHSFPLTHHRPGQKRNRPSRSHTVQQLAWARVRGTYLETDVRRLVQGRLLAEHNRWPSCLAGACCYLLLYCYACLPACFASSSPSFCL